MCGYVLSWDELMEHRKSKEWHVICDGCKEIVRRTAENEICAMLEKAKD